MARRTGKFYSRNEKQTLKSLGLEPAPMSGAGWIVKEDGENETLMVQLKSTDADSYRVSMLDIKKLEYHAEVSNKVPVFLVQFLKQDRTYALVDVSCIDDLFYGLKGIAPDKGMVDIDTISVDTASIYTHTPPPYNPPSPTRKQIKSSAKSREKFFQEKEAKYGKQK